MIPVTQGKEQLREQIMNAADQAIREETEINGKRVIGTLVQRQLEMLEVLDCVQASLESVYTAEKRKTFSDRIIRMCLHPAATLLLAMAALVTALLSVETLHWSYMVLFTALLIIQSVWRLLKESGRDGKKQEPKAEVILEQGPADLFVSRVTGKYKGDSEAISNMFFTRTQDQMQEFENEVIRIFASLYEADLDNPEAEDFRYALSLSRLLLQKMGLKTVSYTPENQKLFTIEPADYRDEMRCPAIIRENTGELVRKGEYIRNNR